MANSKVTKKALIMSALSLVLCFTMLLGTTYAWFTDSVTSTNNKIVAGNLDVELEYATKLDASGVPTEWKALKSDTNVFTGSLWEPGHTEVVYLRVSNLGTLALKYQLGINIVSEKGAVNVEGKPFKLSDYIMFGVVENENTYAEREDAVDAVTAAKKISAGYSKSSTLLAAEKAYSALVVYMPETVGNEANYRGEAPEIDLGINLFATQMTNEEDSFDKYYDAGAVWVGGVDYSWYDPSATEYTISSSEELAGFAAIVNGTAVAPATTYTAGGATTIQDTFEGKTVKLAADLDLNNVDWTPIGTFPSMTQTTTFTYAFRGTFDGQGHTVSNLKVTNAGWAGLFGIAYKATINNVTVNGATINSNRMAGAIVGQLYGSISNCHVKNVNITVSPNQTNSGYDNGDKVGGIVGWIGDNGDNHSLTNSTASNVNIKAYRDLGGIAGYVAWSTKLANNTVTDVSVTADQSVGFYGHKDANAGFIWGRNSVSSSGVGIIDENNKTEGENSKTEIVKDKIITGTSELKTALGVSGEYYLANDVDLTETLTVAKGDEVILHLNGHTIVGTNTATATHNDLFLVKGKLTVTDGAVTLSHNAANMAWNGATSVFDVTDGGVLNIVDATVENLGGTDMAFGVHLNNWGEVTLNVDDSTIRSTYCAVRVFNSGYDMNNVTIKNSVIYSDGNRAFWVHNYLGDLDSAKHPDSAIKARLNFDIFGNGNTYVAKTNTNGGVIRYGFGKTIYFTATGAEIISSVDALMAANGANISLNGTVDLGGTSGNYLTIDQDTTITGGTIKGTGWTGEMNYAVNATSGNIVFDGVTFDTTDWSTDGWAKWGMSVNVSGTANVTFKNCTFKGTQCPIYQSGSNSVITLENCKFESTIGAVQCEIYSGDFQLGQDLIIKKCDFSGVADVLHIYDYDKDPSSEAIAQYLTDNGNIFTGTCKQTCK